MENCHEPERLKRRDFFHVAGAYLATLAMPNPWNVDEEKLKFTGPQIPPYLAKLQRFLETRSRKPEFDPERFLRDPCYRSTLEEGDNSVIDPISFFLTFDDGPLPCTGDILDHLAENDQKATFFLIGQNLTHTKLRNFAIRAVKEGHELANHSYTHPRFSSISSKKAQEEITKTHDLIKEVVREAGGDPKRHNLFFRFPYGNGGSVSMYKTVKKICAELKYRIAWWSLDTYDWRMELSWRIRASSPVIAAFKQVQVCDVVLLHDRNQTAKLLPSLFEVLKMKKLVSVPLSRYDHVWKSAAWKRNRSQG